MHLAILRMKNIANRCILLLLGSLALFNASPALGQKKGPSLKIMSYNIHHANPPSLPGVINTDTIGALISKYRPDLVALQEVDVNTSRSGKSLDEAKAIADKAGLYYRFAKAIDYAGGEYGVAILSRYSFDSFVVRKLPSATAKAEARVLAVGFFHVGKTHFIFACTHLDAEGGNASRLMQIHVIDTILSKDRVPVLLAGDLNSEPSNPVMQIFDEHFQRSCMDSSEYTFPSDRPVKTIDYIGVSKNKPARVVEHRVLPETFPSDHRSIWAEIQIAGSAKRNNK